MGTSHLFRQIFSVNISRVQSKDIIFNATIQIKIFWWNIIFLYECDKINFRAGEITQSVHCWPHNIQGLSSIPRSDIREPGMVALALNPSTEHTETNGSWGSLATQSHTNERHCHKTKINSSWRVVTETDLWPPHSMHFLWTHTYAHTHTNTHLQACKYTPK